MNEDKPTFDRARPIKSGDAASLSTVIARLVGEAVFARLRVDAIESILLDDAGLKQRYYQRLRELLDEQETILGDRLLLSDDAYDEIYPKRESRKLT